SNTSLKHEPVIIGAGGRDAFHRVRTFCGKVGRGGTRPYLPVFDPGTHPATRADLTGLWLHSTFVDMKSLRQFRVLALILALLCTVGCDQASKHIARSQLNPAAPVSLLGGVIELTLAENPGAFLNLGASLPAVWRRGLLTTAVGLGLLLLFAQLATSSRLD